MIDDLSMSVPEVAQVIGIGKNKVYELARTGELASYRIGRKLRFSMRDIDAYLARCRTAGALQPSAAGEAHEFRLDASLPDAVAKTGAPGLTFVGEGLAGDILASLLADAGERVDRRATTSYAALASIYCGQANLASVNLYDAFTNSYNLPYVKRLAPGTPIVVVRLAKRRVGFVCKAGREKRFATWGALLREGVRIANFQRGCGLRVLLDEKLMSMEARPDNIEGYGDEAECVGEALAWIDAGRADVTLGSRQDAASGRGLVFRPLHVETIDLVMRKAPETRRLIRKAKDVTASVRFADLVQAMGDMSAEQAGAVLFEC